MDLETAQQLYDKSLASLMDKVRAGKRGIYRIMMAPEGLILSVRPIRATAKPAASCFTLFVPGDAKRPPRFGALDQLDDHQKRVAEQLRADMVKLLRASEVAYILQSGKSPVLDAAVKDKMAGLADRFGRLPEPAIKHEDEQARNIRAEQERAAEEKEMIWNEVQPTIFEQLLERELKLEAARKQAAAEHEVSALQEA